MRPSKKRQNGTILKNLKDSNHNDSTIAIVIATVMAVIARKIIFIDFSKLSCGVELLGTSLKKIILLRMIEEKNKKLLSSGSRIFDNEITKYPMLRKITFQLIRPSRK